MPALIFTALVTLSLFYSLHGLAGLGVAVGIWVVLLAILAKAADGR